MGQIPLARWADNSWHEGCGCSIVNQDSNAFLLVETDPPSLPGGNMEVLGWV